MRGSRHNDLHQQIKLEQDQNEVLRTQIAALKAENERLRALLQAAGGEQTK